MPMLLLYVTGHAPKYYILLYIILQWQFLFALRNISVMVNKLSFASPQEMRTDLLEYFGGFKEKKK